MTLDVDAPEPPALLGPRHRGEYDAVVVPEDDDGDDYRREELVGFLEDGAWYDGFEEWADDTTMTEAEFDLAADLGLFEAYDFYWDPATDEVGYRAPSIPDELPDRDPDDREASDVDMKNIDLGGIDAELDTLGRVVSEVLENDYVIRDEETFGFFADDGYPRDDPDSIE